MLVSQTSPVEVELFSYVNAFLICWFCEWNALHMCCAFSGGERFLYENVQHTIAREHLRNVKIWLGFKSRERRLRYPALYWSLKIYVFPNSRSQTFSNVKSDLNRCPSYKFLPGLKWDFSNSLIIHKEKTKEILKCLMRVWKSDEKLLIFASLISPSKIILLEK